MLQSGKVYTWGCNVDGELGRHTQGIYELTPGLVEASPPVVWKNIAASEDYTLLLSASE